MPANSGVNVIVCVHDALDDVRVCLESVLASDPPGPMHLILVDDGSGDDTRLFLEDFAKRHQATLRRNARAKGYTRAVNTGLRARRKLPFTVLLNSDTVVPVAWLRKMMMIFEARPDVGIVGPLSNAASWQSVPAVVGDDGGFAVNILPDGWSVDDMDAIIGMLWKRSPVYPRVPLLNGFCLMIAEQVFARVGEMDEKSFPKGYGEENDFCFRCTDAGFGIMVAANTYVYHAKSKSYTKTTRNELARASGEVLQRKYPNQRVFRASRTLRQNAHLAEIRQIVSSVLYDGAP